MSILPRAGIAGAKRGPGLFLLSDSPMGQYALALTLALTLALILATLLVVALLHGGP